MKESDIQRAIMVSLSPKTILFRNNVGAYRKPDGSWLTYGLQNPGGSDLIGWSTIEITPEMVGRKMAIFTAIEVKRKGGKPSEDQKRFIAACSNSGAIAGVASSNDEAEKIVLQFMQHLGTIGI